MDDYMNKLVPGLLSLHFDQFWWRLIKKTKKIWILLVCQYVCFELEKEKSLPPPKKTKFPFLFLVSGTRHANAGRRKYPAQKKRVLGSQQY